jgi:raffinose/stachyose/melibiose transport system permease protein
VSVETAPAVSRPAREITVPATRGIRYRRKAFHGLIHLFLILAVAVALLPVLLTVQASFKTLYDFYGNALGFPATWEWRNYTNVWREAHIPEYTRNSIIVTFTSVPAILALSCCAAYGLTHYNFKGSRWIYIYFLAGLLVPIQLTILPTVFQLKTLHLVDTRPGLIICSVALGLPFSVFLMAGFMRTLPRELAEAAQLDGAGEFRAFWDVMLPLTRPALATVAILNGVGIWNDFFLPLILAPDVPTLQVGVNNLRGYYSTEWGYIFAGVTLSALPVIVAYWLLTKQFIRGLSAGALKG